MAALEQIAELRRLISEPTSETFTDEVLSARLDATPDIRVLAGTIWREKAASYAGLVDIQEGSSTRKMSQLYAQALKIADSFDAGAGVVAAGRRPATSRPIERQ